MNEPARSCQDSGEPAILGEILATLREIRRVAVRMEELARSDGGLEIIRAEAALRQALPGLDATEKWAQAVMVVRHLDYLRGAEDGAAGRVAEQDEGMPVPRLRLVVPGPRLTVSGRSPRRSGPPGVPLQGAPRAAATPGRPSPPAA